MTGRILSQILLALLPLGLFAQSNPSPYNLSSGNYSLIQWPSNSPAGTYPASMVFQTCSDANAGINTATTADYTGIYNGNSGPRFNGLSANGFYIAGVYNASPSVGAAVLALNSVGRGSIQLSFQVSTLLAGNPASLRLQYRPASNNATWTDVPGPIEYVSNGATSINATTFNVNLSNLIGAQIDNRPAFQLRWKYYRTSGTGANDCAIAIDEININSQALPAPAISTGLVPALSYCVTPTVPTPLVLPFQYTPATAFNNSDFTVEMSDTAGSFLSPVTVGQVASDNTGSQFVTVTIPQNTATGRGYRFRVRNNTYGVVGNDNAAPFSINLVPVAVTGIIPNARYKSILINWTSPISCWDEVMVVARQGSLPTGIPNGDGSAYTANQNYGQGTQIADGFVVYKGRATTAEIKSIVPEISYGFNIWTRYGVDWYNATTFSVITPEIASVNGTPSKVTLSEYFWNTDPGAGNGTPMTVVDGNYSSAFEQLSKSGLLAPNNGRNVFNLRIKDGAGTWSTVFSIVINVDSVDTHPGYALQNLIQAEYFINQDPGVGNASPLIALDGNINQAFENLLINGLQLSKYGRSTFNVRVKDRFNNWSPIFTTIINVDSTDTHPGYTLSNLTQAEYWWDYDSTNGRPMIALDGNFNQAFEKLFVNGLTVPHFGRSIFNVRVKKRSGDWSPVFKTIIHTDSLDTHPGYALSKLIQAEYWWNTDPGAGNATPMIALDGNFNAAFENLFRNGLTAPRFGRSTFNVRIKASDNTWSGAFTTIINVDSLDTYAGYPLQNLIQAEYWWNTDPGVGNATPMLALDGNFNAAYEQLLASGLRAPQNGRSTFNIRVRDRLNNWSDKFTTVINVDSTTASPVIYMPQRIKQQEYFWDTDPGEGNGTLMTVSDGYANSAYELFKMPTGYVQSLPNGTHLLGMRAKDANGAWGTVFKTTIDVNVGGNTFAVYTNPAYTIRCQGQSVTLNALGGVSYTWSPAEGLSSTTGASVVATPTQTTTYTVTGTNSFGLTSTATVTVVVTSPASIQGPSSIDICPGQSIQLTSSSALGNYWTTGATTQSITVSQPGTYTLISENGCGVNASSVVVNQLPVTIPTISASGPTQFCVGDAVVLTASEGVTFLWSNGSSDQSVYITESGNYTVTVTPDGGCPATSLPLTVTASQVPNASITASGSTTICSGNYVTLNATTGTGLTYEWLKDGLPIANSNASSFNVISSGYYSVIVTYLGCSALSSPTYVTVTPLPNAVITPAGSTTICAGGSVLLQGPGGSGLTYQWKLNGNNISGATTQNYSATAPGNYTLFISAGTCSSTSTAVTVTVTSLPTANITTSGSLTFCQGASVSFTASAGTGYTYQWYKNSVTITNATNQTYTANTAGVYYVVVSANGCQATSVTKTVVLNALPTAQITPAGPTGFCTGGSVLLNATTGTGYSYQWKLNGINLSGAIASSYTAIQAGNYTVTVTASACPVTSSIVSVQVGSPITATIAATGSTTVCAGNTVLLTANTGSGLTYQWKKDGNDISGATSSTYSASSTGSYTAIVYNNGCPSTSNAISVTITPAFSVNINAVGSANICAGGSVLLQGEQVTGYNYKWRLNGDTIPGANQYQYAVFQSGSYSLTVSYGGCTIASSPLTVNEVLPTVKILPNTSQTLCQGDSVTLTANVQSGYSFQWVKNGTPISGATFLSFVAKTAGIYSLNFSSQQCSGTSNTVQINVNPIQNASVSISLTSGNNPGCSGGLLTFTANATNGGGNPIYQWKVNGVNVGTNSNSFTSSALSNGSLVTCEMISSATCLASTVAASNSILVNTIKRDTTYQSAVSCNSYSWNGVNYTQSGQYSYQTQNTFGCDSIAILNLTINVCGSDSMHLKLFLEGFYTGNGKMKTTLYDLGISTDSLATDSISVNLWSPLNLSSSNPVISIKAILKNNGEMNFVLPGFLVGNYYYIAIKHRNTIETWSKQPVLLSNNTFYDFTNSILKSYADEGTSSMKLLENGIYAFFSGDLNQDGTVDGSDMNVVDNNTAAGVFGYEISDVNGDGATDGLDMNIVDNNTIIGIFYSRPY